MKKYINLGYANGWSEKVNDLYDVVIFLMKQDPSYKSHQVTLGRSDTEYHHSTNKFEIVYKVDSSD